MEEQKRKITTLVSIFVVVVLIGGIVTFILSNKFESFVERNENDTDTKSTELSLQKNNTQEIEDEDGDGDDVPSKNVVNQPPVKPVVNTQVTTPPSTSVPGKTTASAYKNGTFSAIGGYDSPAGWDTIKVSLTLADGVVTNVVVAPEAVASNSLGWVKRFTSGVNNVVVGVKIDGLNLSQVSGSSLTAQGFNDAVSKIKVQAKA